MDATKGEGTSTVSSKVRAQKRNKMNNIIRRIECTLCGKEISDKGNLNRHLRSVHGVQPKIRKPRIKCSFSKSCSFVCGTRTVFRSHLETVHGFSIVKNVYRFENRANFEKWKEEEEMKTCASYVTDTGVKNRNKKKIYYLRCHRSGLIRAEQNEKKMRLRSKPLRGYTQCGLTCPSSMQIVEYQNGTIEVSYFPKHLGHRTDDESVRYIKLRKKEKEEITAKLVEGESISKIVNEARVKYRGEKLSRVNVLQRRDVYNIKSKVTFLEKEVDQDGKFVDSWVSHNNFGIGNSPVAFYKPMDKNNDYILIIIHHIQKILFSLLFDGSMIYVKTMKGKAKVDFNLNVVYAVNANGTGYPLAFCVSSKTDCSIISNFFKVLYDVYGSINTHIFISDNINYYYTAWKNIMGEPENRLICNFNIQSLWERKLLELQCPFKKQKTVSNELKSLLCETDANRFDLELVRMLNTWNEDSDLKRFVQYFYKFYCKKPREWAHCYRMHSARKENINLYLEPLYKQMERIYMEGGKNLLNALNSILILIRNECYIHFIKLDEDILEEKLREINANHEASKDIDDVIFNGSEWIVQHCDQYYNVMREENTCGKECGLMCSHCDICVHSFSCSCSDYLINFTICFHIHAVMTCNLSKESEGKFTAKSALKFSAVWKPNLELLNELEASGGILSLAACENILYSCSTAEVIQCWDLNTGREVGELTTTLSQPQKLFFDKRCNILWAGDGQGNVSKFENGKECGQYALIEEIWDIMVYPPFVYTARDRDVVVCEIVVGSSGTRVVVKSTLEGRSPFCIAGSHLCFFDRDGRRIIVHENSLEKKFPRLKDIPASDLIVNAIAAASDNVIYTGGYDSVLKKWDLNDSKCRSSVNLSSCINSISVRSEDDVYVATSEGSLFCVGASLS